MDKVAEAARSGMDVVIELDNEGRIWVSTSDGVASEEAWLQGAHETSDALRASGLCLLEEKYTPGTWTSTTLDAREIAGQLRVEASRDA
jgi:hypothetical protein